MARRVAGKRRLARLRTRRHSLARRSLPLGRQLLRQQLARLLPAAGLDSSLEPPLDVSELVSGRRARPGDERFDATCRSRLPRAIASVQRAPRSRLADGVRRAASRRRLDHGRSACDSSSTRERAAAAIEVARNCTADRVWCAQLDRLRARRRRRLCPSRFGLRRGGGGDAAERAVRMDERPSAPGSRRPLGLRPLEL